MSAAFNSAINLPDDDDDDHDHDHYFSRNSSKVVGYKSYSICLCKHVGPAKKA
jgi:hypothetical protein